MVVNRAAAMVLPVAAKFIVDDVMEGRRATALVPLGVAAAVALAIEAAAASRMTTLTGDGAQRMVTSLRDALHAHVIRLPVPCFDATRTGELLSRIVDDTEQVRAVLGSVAVSLGGAIITAAAALAVMAWVNWPIALGIFVVFAAWAALVARTYAAVCTAQQSVSTRQSALSARLVETLAGVRTIKSRCAEDSECVVFRGHTRALSDAVVACVRRVARLTAVITVAPGAAGVLLLVLGASAIQTGAMTLGDLAMVAYLTGLVASPLVQAAAICGEIGKAGAGLARIRTMFAVDSEDIADRNAEAVTRVVGAVEFDGVSYVYAGGCLALREVSLFVPPRSTVAIVGASGAGKSTLCRLLLAFDRPTQGRVLIDGRDLSGLKRRDYRAFVAAVLQDDVLFSGTVADAIGHGREACSRVDVEAAAALAHCDGFIAAMPNGYDTMIGERGVRLSGGQRQRLAIARALLAAPAILLLDEAMSSLDAESEAAVQDGLDLLRQGRTTFVIAHRLSTIRSADHIVVLEHGRVVEQGVHDELIARHGVYRRLYERQWRGEQERHAADDRARRLVRTLGANARIQ